ncbi:MAG: zinc-ribbon domain-containing protein, partial [Blastocatellia bacterium]|nr:zinc-ribbon domain-containing protein [Blastocatellia bacterium]
MTRFCKECGAAVTETARFCNKCGVQLEATESSPGETAPGTTYQTKAQEGANYGPSPYQPPAQAGYQSPDANAELKHHTAAMLCYPLFFITGIIFLVLNPYNKDKFVRFNAYQSIFFTVTLLALNI